MRVSIWIDFKQAFSLDLCLLQHLFLSANLMILLILFTFYCNSFSINFIFVSFPWGSIWYFQFWPIYHFLILSFRVWMLFCMIECFCTFYVIVIIIIITLYIFIFIWIPFCFFFAALLFFFSVRNSLAYIITN